jgi:hypothetical protein
MAHRVARNDTAARISRTDISETMAICSEEIIAKVKRDANPDPRKL